MFAAVTLLLGVWAIIGLAAATALLAAAASPTGRSWLRGTLAHDARPAILGAWIVALVATVGSLYFSDGVGFVPCLLCWYQRILMYPLVLLLGVALVLREPEVWRLTIALPLVGLLIAVYHVALQFRPSLEIVACSEGAPCSGRYIAIFGFISIPTLAAVAFLLIGALLIAAAVVERAPEGVS